MRIFRRISRHTFLRFKMARRASIAKVDKSGWQSTSQRVNFTFTAVPFQGGLDQKKKVDTATLAGSGIGNALPDVG